MQRELRRLDAGRTRRTLGPLPEQVGRIERGEANVYAKGHTCDACGSFVSDPGSGEVFRKYMNGLVAAYN